MGRGVIADAGSSPAAGADEPIAAARMTAAGHRIRESGLQSSMRIPYGTIPTGTDLSTLRLATSTIDRSSDSPLAT